MKGNSAFLVQDCSHWANHCPPQGRWSLCHQEGSCWIYLGLTLSCCPLFRVRGRKGLLAYLFRKMFVSHFVNCLWNWGILPCSFLFTFLECAFSGSAHFILVTFFRLRFFSTHIKPFLLAFCARNIQ